MIKVEADFSSPFIKEVAEVYYSLTAFEIEFNEEINIRLNDKQFEDMFIKMFETYSNICGEKMSRKLIQSIEEKAVV